MPRRSQTKHGYHHGDLGNAALAEALVVLGERGPGGVTFAEVARRLGVTAAALYRHYSHPSALLAAAAVESFVLFERSLRTVKAKSPRERLRAMSNAYLAFARRHPARYALMFGTRFEERPEALEHASKAAFDLLVEALTVCRPEAPPATIVKLAKQVWALCHGFATLGNVETMALREREAQRVLWDALRLIVEGAAA